MCRIAVLSRAKATLASGGSLDHRELLRTEDLISAVQKYTGKEEQALDWWSQYILCDSGTEIGCRYFVSELFINNLFIQAAWLISWTLFDQSGLVQAAGWLSAKYMNGILHTTSVIERYRKRFDHCSIVSSGQIIDTIAGTPRVTRLLEMKLFDREENVTWSLKLRPLQKGHTVEPPKRMLVVFQEGHTNWAHLMVPTMFRPLKTMAVV